VSLLDYYLVGADGVLVEEFVRAPDHSTVGLRGVVWTRPDAGWRGAAALSRALRADPRALARMTPIDRDGAETAFRGLCGEPLPDEAALRAHGDYRPFPTSAPLRLGPADAPDGFHERRVYRVLFAKDLDADGLAALEASWQPARRRIGADLVSWTLRRVGGGIAWGLDVTVLLVTDDDAAVGPVLRDLTAAVRRQGLIPVTTERFA
jgi:hypothetical protein